MIVQMVILVEYAVKKARFGFHKTIAEKSHHGKTKEFIKLAESLKYRLGITRSAIWNYSGS